MILLTATIAFILGLAAGSFLNVAILRGARGESLGGRSRCESCRTVLSPQELLPVLSFVIQKGRCLHCGAVLSWQYPAVEFATALIFGAIAWFVFLSPAANAESVLYVGAAFITAAAAIAIFVSDLRFQIIPTWPTAVMALVGAAAALIRSNFGADAVILLYDLGGAVFFSLFFASLWFVSGGRWMGLGDAKLIPATSLILGFPANVTACLFAFWSGALGGLILMAFGKKGLRDQVPFGPYILLGAALAYFLSEKFLVFIGVSEFL